MQVQNSNLNFATSAKGTVSDGGLTNPTGAEEAYAIDGNAKTKWLVYQSTGMLTYTFNSLSSSNKINSYAITSANDAGERDPKSWKLEGSTDGTNWTTLDTQTNITFSNRYEREVFRFTNAYNYKYYRLNITANNGSTEYTQLADFELMMVSGDQIDYAYDEDENLYGFYYNGTPYIYVRNGQNDIIGILDSNGNQVVSYEYDSWGKVLFVTGSMASTIGERNPFRYRGYYYDTETGLFYVGSRYYDPVTCRMANADDTDVLDVQDDLNDKNLFAYCDNNPVVRVDHDGDIWDFIDFGFAAWSWGDFIAKPSWGNFGWAMLDTVCLLPLIPSVGYATRPAKIISKTSKATKVVRGFGKLSKAEKYGIKSYKALTKVLKGTGLQAHHIVEQRLAKALGLNANNMLSVAVTAAEHQKFTNDWRRLVAYGSDYSKLTRGEIWGYAQQVYKDYSELLSAAKKTLFR